MSEVITATLTSSVLCAPGCGPEVLLRPGERFDVDALAFRPLGFASPPFHVQLRFSQPIRLFAVYLSQAAARTSSSEDGVSACSLFADLLPNSALPSARLRGRAMPSRHAGRRGRGQRRTRSTLLATVRDLLPPFGGVPDLCVWNCSLSSLTSPASSLAAPSSTTTTACHPPTSSTLAQGVPRRAHPPHAPLLGVPASVGAAVRYVPFRVPVHDLVSAVRVRILRGGPRAVALSGVRVVYSSEPQVSADTLHAVQYIAAASVARVPCPSSPHSAAAVVEQGTLRRSMARSSGRCNGATASRAASANLSTTSRPASTNASTAARTIAYHAARTSASTATLLPTASTESTSPLTPSSPRSAPVCLASSFGSKLDLFACAPDPPVQAVRHSPTATEVVPEHLLDCITLEVMRDPVRLPSGKTVDRTTIERHLRHHSTDPFTGLLLRREDLVDDVRCRLEVQSFLSAATAPAL
jgi:U-box domain